jgi:putative oxidoreductase
MLLDIGFQSTTFGRELAYSAQLGIAMVFVASAVPKLLEPLAFTRTVAGYGVLPRQTARIVAPVLIALETLLAVGLLTGAAAWATLPVGAVLVALFAVVTTVNLARGRITSCGCFGSESEVISGKTVARLVVLLVAILGFALAVHGGRADVVTIGDIASRAQSPLAYVLVHIGTAAGALVVCMFAYSWREVVTVLAALRRHSADVGVIPYG